MRTRDEVEPAAEADAVRVVANETTRAFPRVSDLLRKLMLLQVEPAEEQSSKPLIRSEFGVGDVKLSD